MNYQLRGTRCKTARQQIEKNCCVCNLTKSFEEFGNQDKYKDGKKYECKKCACQIKKKSYNRTYQREKRYQAKLDLMNLLGGKCVDCNIKPNDNEWPIACFDFHHTDKNKEAQVSHLFLHDSRFSEAEKCIILCANCHRRRHFLERKNRLTDTAEQFRLETSGTKQRTKTVH